jgi:exodeoxyribonuclease VII small subunit
MSPRRSAGRGSGGRTGDKEPGVTERGSSSKAGRPPAELSFEAALEQVEGIIDRIERGEVGLEESLSEYERGVELIKRCRAILRRAEQRVEELTARMKADESAEA